MVQFQKKIHISFLLLALVSFQFAKAEGLKEKIDSQLGVGFGVGQLGNSKAGLKNRTMESFNIDGIVGYKTEHAVWGVHFDYRIQEQLTSVSSAGGTNLKGRGLLLGIAAKQEINDEYHIIYALDFLGKYDLEKDTSTSENDDLRSPLAFHVRGGGYFFNQYPQLSLDVDLMYAEYKTLHINGVSHSWASKQLNVGVFVTYHFGPKSRSGSSGQDKSSATQQEGR